MNPRFLLDTNVISEPLKQVASPLVLTRLRQHRNELALAATSWHELWFGCYRLPLSRRRTELEHYLNEIVAEGIAILPFDAEAAHWLAAERARLVALGLPPAVVDGQIAAVAVIHGLVLVTRNVANFAHFRNLSIENWFEP